MIARLRDEGPAALTVLMVLAVGAILACCLGALLGGCAEVRLPADASSPDGAVINGCSTVRNALETSAADCPWRDWGCPFNGPVPLASAQACAEAVYAAGGDCEATRQTLLACE